MIQDYLLVLLSSVCVQCLVALVTGLVVYWLIQKWKYKFPPGPSGLPLLGNSLQIDFKTLHEQVFEWSKKYGPVLTIRIGPKRTVFVNAIDTAVEVLVKKSTDFAGRMKSPSKNIRHFTDNLFLARLEAEEEEEGETASALDKDHLVQTLADIYFAGIDTSRHTLRFALLHMVAFPDIQEKVQKEIDNVVGRDRLPGVKDRPNLGYTEAVLHERMRLGTVSPTGLFHMMTCDTDIAGYRIPKGTNVAVNYWGLHHDPEAWDDVDRFIPERYLSEDGKLGPKPKNWLPFSAGTRACLGEFVAKPKLHLFFAGLLQRYK